MANTVIALKKSATPSAQPSVLANGELAINYSDGKLFYKHANGTILPFNTQGGNAFGTVNANGTLVVAGSSEAILTLIPGNNISITADAINDTITINSTGSSAPVNGSVEITTSQLKDLTTENTVVTGVTSFTGTVVDSTVAVAAFDKANSALPNTSGVSFAGNLYFPTGNVGIGTTSPTSNLHVVGRANITSNLIVQGTDVVNEISNTKTIAIAAFDKANTGGSGGSGSLTVFSANVGNGASNTFNVTHNLSSFWILTSVREISTGDIVYPDLRQTTANNLIITFVDNPTANQYALLVAKVA